MGCCAPITEHNGLYVLRWTGQNERNICVAGGNVQNSRRYMSILEII